MPGYPDALIGEVLAARGVGATIGFFVAMFLGRLDPRIGMGIGFGLQVISGLWLMSIDLNVSMEILVANSMLQGMAIGIIWVPLTIASFATLDNRYWPEAMAIFHLLRNIGSSFFISLCVADIVRVTAQNYSRLTEMISPFNERLAMPWVMGGWSTDTLAGLGPAIQGDQPTGGDDRLSRCFRDVYRRLGDGDGPGPAGAPASRRQHLARCKIPCMALRSSALAACLFARSLRFR